MKVRLALLLVAVILCRCGQERTAARKPKTKAGMSLQAVEAARRGDDQTLGALVEKTPEFAAGQDEEGKTLLHHAVEAGKVSTVKVLLEKGASPRARDNDGLTPLHLAAAEGRAEIAKLLLEKGADPNAKANDGSTPLHAATDHPAGVPEHQGCVEIVRMLVERGADVNVAGRRGETPLHLAARHGHKEVAEVLLAARADTNARAGIYQETPLHYAAAYGHKAVVEALLEHSADINARDKHGRTPLARARQMRHRDIAELLAQRGGAP